MLRDLVDAFPGDLLGTFPGDLGQVVLEMSLRDQMFLAVALMVFVLLALTAVFTPFTILHRRRITERNQELEEFAERVRPWLLAALAGETSLENLQRQLEPDESLDFVRLLMEYTGRVRGDDLELLRRMARPHFDAVVEASQSRSAERRAHAVRILGTLGFSEYRAIVEKALDDPSPVVALMAAHALAEEGGAKYARPILSRLHRFERYDARHLAEMIAGMGGEVVPALRWACVREDTPPEVRAIAADAIRQGGYPEAADAAVQILKRTEPVEATEKEGGEVTQSGGQRELVLSALRILGELGRDEHVWMARSYAEHPDPVIRALAASALGELGDREDVPFLVERLLDPSRWVALHAARALKALRAMEELWAVAESEGDRGVLCREVLAE